MKHLSTAPLLLLLACTSESHIATTSTGVADGGAETPDAGSAPPFETFGPAEYCGEPDQEPAVTWDGWIEAFTFRGGSDRVRVFLEPDGAGGSTGYFVGGAGPHIDAVPRSPDDCAFLCDVPVHEAYANPGHFQEGFRFTLQNVVYTDTRLRFDIDKHEIFDAWCRAQPPIPGTDKCIEYESAYEDQPDDCYLTQADGSEMPIPCCKFTLCNFVCACTTDECRAQPNLETFDLFIEGDVASGTTPFGTGHLQRRVAEGG